MLFSWAAFDFRNALRDPLSFSLSISLSVGLFSTHLSTICLLVL